MARRASSGRLNAVMVATGYGARFVPVVGLAYGFELQNTEVHARRQQTMYTRRSYEKDFGITMQFADHREFHEVGQWLLLYGRLVVDPDRAIGPIRVVVPSENFDRTGVPTSPIPMGDDHAAVTYQMPVTFEGANEPITAHSEPGSAYWARFLLPESADKKIPHFYPASVTLGGSYSHEDRLYDSPGIKVPNLPGLGQGGI